MLPRRGRQRYDDGWAIRNRSAVRKDAVGAPGGLTELGEELGSWDARVAEVTASVKPPPSLTQANRTNATELRVPDWPAVPVRARACLGGGLADQRCDAHLSSGETGRLFFQEEYAEWRVLRDEAGPTRFELTTELGDYWVLLARHRPERLVELVSEFADEPSLGAAEVFGDLDSDTSDARAEAFSRRFLGRSLTDKKWRGLPGPLNNGERAITCLSRGDNSLSALVNLVAASAVALHITDGVDGEPRFPSGSEAIPRLTGNAAQDCRASDPLIVERIVRVATEGRPIRFDDPIGVYIAAVQSQDLLDPGGRPIPDEWFERSRQGPPLADGLVRHQRLTLEVPQDAGFDLSDIISRRTGEPIRWGAQIAELVEIAVYVRVGDPGIVQVEADLLPPADPVPCAARDECAGLQESAALIQAATE